MFCDKENRVLSSKIYRVSFVGIPNANYHSRAPPFVEPKLNDENHFDFIVTKANDTPNLGYYLLAPANIEQKAYGASLNATIGIVSVIRLSLKAD